MTFQRNFSQALRNLWFGEPDELHGAIHYLLTEASRFVTGTTIVVDGGFGIDSGV